MNKQNNVNLQITVLRDRQHNSGRHSRERGNYTNAHTAINDTKMTGAPSS